MNKNAVAIIGIGCRLPGGVKTPQDLWKILINKKDVITEVPEDRWNKFNFYHAKQNGKSYSRWGGFLDQIDQFDPQFFGISPREAYGIDPQQRLLLEMSWEAIEDAGVLPARIENTNTGVYVGISSHDYCDLQTAHESRNQIDAYTQTGACNSIAANRISYTFDLKGPSLSIDTACSSALVALDYAFHDLANGKCQMALVGGIQILIRPEVFVGFSMASMLSPTGRCHSFGAKADGFVRAEGGGVLFLKTYEQAIADKNNIYAVIVGSATNQDGKTKGLTVPNQEAQMSLIETACDNANLSPDLIQYIEAHGTGTPVGDPIEANALGRIIGQKRTHSPCIVGSVKSNIGHLESASGMAGILKTVLALKNKKIPATLHANPLNPHIPFAELNLHIATETMDWPENQHDHPRYAGVNSFGFGGANAHVLLTEAHESTSAKSAQKKTPRANSTIPVLLPISGHNEATLRNNAAAYRNYCQRLLQCHTHRKATQENLINIAHSAALHRTHHRYRLTVIGEKLEDWIDGLQSFDKGEALESINNGKVVGHSKPLVFVFSGMGQQWWGMCIGLIGTQPVFDAMIAKCDTALRQYVDWSLIEELTRDQAQSRINETQISQPAIFSVQVALCALLAHWGIKPDMIVGHSVGEVAAAFVSGALSFDDAVKVVYHRSRLQSLAVGKGSMLALSLPSNAAQDFIVNAEVTVAAINSPCSVTLAGNKDELRIIAQKAADKSVFNRFLPVEVPYHSPMMEPYKAELMQSLDEIKPRSCHTSLFSTVLGSQLSGFEMDAQYWVDNMREPVRFYQALQAIFAENSNTQFLEISAHPVLHHSIKESIPEQAKDIEIFHALYRERNNLRELMKTAGLFYTRGNKIRWNHISPPGRLVSLPLYHWQRERFWKESEDIANKRIGLNKKPLLGIKSSQPWLEFELDLNDFSLPWLLHHKIQDQIIFPAAAYLEMVLEAIQQTMSVDETLTITNICFHSALTVTINEVKKIKLVLEENQKKFSIYSLSEGGNIKWQLHADGFYCANDRYQPPQRLKLDQLHKKCPEIVSRDTVYQQFDYMGMHYSEVFQGVRSLWRGEGESLAFVDISQHDCSVNNKKEGYIIHPALLDSVFQSLIACLPRQQQHSLWPVSINKFQLYSTDLTSNLYCHGKIVNASPRGYQGDLVLFDKNGTLIGNVTGLRLKKVENRHMNITSSEAIDQYEYRWHLDKKYAHHWPGFMRQSPDKWWLAMQRDELIHGSQYCREDYYHDVRFALNSLAVGYFFRALRALGWSPKTGDTFSIKAFAKTLGIDEKQNKLFSRIITIFCEEGMLAIDANDNAATNQLRYRVVRTLDTKKLESQWREALARYPAYLAEFSLVWHCGKSLSAILSGEQDPVNVMYPAMSDMLEHLYQDSPSTKIFNHLTKKIVQQAIQDLPEHRPLRVLEIGAGAGGLTASMLEIVPPEQTIYVFTEVADAFLNQAKGKFSHSRLIEYQLLDIERDPLEQGFTANSFDLIIAFDVLHMTKELAVSLRNIKTLLAREGLLLLIELTKKERWLDLVFGLLPEWWRFDDTTLRGEHPLLTGQQWQALLTDLGFQPFGLLTDVAEQPETLQTVVCAQHRTEPSTETAWITPTLQPLKQENNCKETWIVVNGEGNDVTLLTQILAKSEIDFVQIQNEKTEPSSSSKAYCQTLKALKNTGQIFKGMIFLGALNPSLTEALTLKKLKQDQQHGLLQMLDLSQAINKLWVNEPFHLWVITQGTWILNNDTQGAVSHAPLWGLARVVMNEFSHISTHLIDMSLQPSAADWEIFIQELINPTAEDELAIRNNLLYHHRMHPLSIDVQSPSQVPPFQLALAKAGRIDNVYFRETQRLDPQEHEVEIEVKAVSLNFKDIAKAMGLLSEETMEGAASGFQMGLECSGTVTQVGRAVTNFAEGDEVIALLPRNGIGKFSLCHHLTTYHKPNNVNFQAAVTIPVVFFTAYYALKCLARIKPKEKILIHTGTGGVGLAAIQIALAQGCEVFTTAGTPLKREWLRSMGVHHVMDSRNISFAAEIKTITNSQGVDVVLNSLPGDMMLKSIDSLAPFGRFIEIGKKDIEQNQPLYLRAFQNNLSYFSLDSDRLAMQQPELAAKEMNELLKHFEKATYTPLPYRAFDFSHVKMAMRYMSQAKHMGKVVLSMNHCDTLSVDTKRRSLNLCANESFLVAGGLTGFGLATAEWLADAGAKSLILVGRRGIPDEATATKIKTLQQRGIQVTVAKIDISVAQQVDTLINKIQLERPPLKGIFIAAMVLDDGPLKEMTHQRFINVMNPKIFGAWNLHQKTLDIPLKYFVMYSSMTTSVGNTHQANYVAANLFMEQLAVHRKHLKLPALTIGWGAIGDVGHVATHEETKNYLSKIGLRSISAKKSLAMMGNILMDQKKITNRYLASIDWEAWNNTHTANYSLRYAHLISEKNQRSADDLASSHHDIFHVLLHGQEHEIQAWLKQKISIQIAKILQMSEHQIDNSLTLIEMGIDSLMVVELSHWLEKELMVPIPTMRLFGDITVDDLVILVKEQLLETVRMQKSLLNQPGEQQSKLNEYQSRQAVPVEDEKTGEKDDRVNQDEIVEVII